jgi:hypothetical protein
METANHVITSVALNAFAEEIRKQQQQKKKLRRESGSLKKKKRRRSQKKIHAQRSRAHLSNACCLLVSHRIAELACARHLERTFPLISCGVKSNHWC